MNKYLITTCVFCILILVLFVGTYSRLAKSVAKENIFPVMCTILKLHITQSEMVQVNSFKDGDGVITNAFIVRTKAGHHPVVQYMKERGWELDEQVGSSLFFKKDSGHTTMSYKQIINKYYRLVTVDEK